MLKHTSIQGAAYRAVALVVQHSARWTTAAALLASAAFSQAQAAGAVVTTPQVRAELVAHAPDGLQAGKPAWLGLKIEHQPHWHTYWKNPGDSGLPTTLDWQLPQGLQAGDIQWPAPRRLPIGPLMNHGYEGTLLLPVPLTVTAQAAGDSVTVKLHAEWLVCKEVCIPESGDFELKLPVQAATAGHAALFAQAAAAKPATLSGVNAVAQVVDGQLRLAVQGLPAAWQGRTLQSFPEESGLLQAAAAQNGQWSDGRYTVALSTDPQRSTAPQQVQLVLVAEGLKPEAPAAVQVSATVEGGWPATAGGAATATAPSAAPAAPAAATTSFWAAVALALLGGLLLNLMPCVFPVLSLKVLGFARHADDRRGLLLGGLAYTVGVVASFLALAGLLLALRAGGEQLGWGFQLQSPAVVAVLAGLFTLIGLNLAGVFEVGSLLPGEWAAAQARNPIVDALLTGVLAVAVASPCTAPFMGASLGAAVTLPTAQALTVFGALGLGMALPYLAASAWPRLAQALPRPGVWMAHFKTVMAFPMFATVVWLVWVLGQQAGIDGAAALLLLLVLLGFAAWAWGSPQLGPQGRRGFGAVAVLVLAAGAWWTLPQLKAQPVEASAKGTADGEWQAWSAEQVRQAQANGQTVFVDFTAAWCVTCQFNKRTTLSREDVKAAYAASRVLLMRADWTRRDPAITAELQRLGRSGVPVYAVYRPGAALPELLSEMPSADEVKQAVAKAR